MKSTIMDIMKNAAARFDSLPALKTKINGKWQETSWEAYHSSTRTAARAFMALGLEPGRSVCILGTNRPEWFIADLGAIFAGGMATGIYTTSSPEQCRYIAEHSDADILVAENKDQLAKFKAVLEHLPRIKAIVIMEGEDEDFRVHTWKDLERLAQKVPDKDLDLRIAQQSPDDCCTLIYTSGTTGDPKGVMITHDNAMWTAGRLVESTHANREDKLISYLPLSHIAEQIATLYSPLICGSCTFCVQDIDTLGQTLAEVRPTIFIGVPRVWEKIQAKMMEAGRQNSGLKKKIAAWARQVGIEWGKGLQEGKSPPLLFRPADSLVFSKVRQKLGFDHCRLFFSSTAPISMDTLEFFMSLGIPITEIYGMSECTGPATLSLPRAFKFRTGWAGQAMDGTQISTAEDGEVLMRGRHVFKGYYKNKTASKEALASDGWLSSGDIGRIDDAGFLKITDRKKELIITSGGENIAPQVLEGKFKAIPAVSQVVVIGNNRKYPSALITLNPLALRQEARIAGSTATTAQEAAGCEKFNIYLQAQINKINRTLSRVQAIKRFTILPEEFSIDGGELTHTMKLKRRVVHEKYASSIEAMYA